MTGQRGEQPRQRARRERDVDREHDDDICLDDVGGVRDGGRRAAAGWLLLGEDDGSAGVAWWANDEHPARLSDGVECAIEQGLGADRQQRLVGSP